MFSELITRRLLVSSPLSIRDNDRRAFVVLCALRALTRRRLSGHIQTANIKVSNVAIIVNLKSRFLYFQVGSDRESVKLFCERVSALMCCQRSLEDKRRLDRTLETSIRKQLRQYWNLKKCHPPWTCRSQAVFRLCSDK